MKTRAGITALLLCLLLCTSALADYAVVTGTDSLNLRSGPSSGSTWLGKYNKGTWVETVGSQNNFYQVYTPDGKTGYMSKNYLSVAQASLADVAIVQNQKATAFLNLRSYPSYNSSVVTILYNGVPLYILDSANGWLHVTINDMQGYVRSEYTYNSYQAANSIVATIKTPNNTRVNMRSGPGGTYPVVKQFQGDRYVMVLEQGNGWCYTSIDGYTGFISSDFLVQGLHAARDESAQTGGTGSAYAVVNNPRSTQWLNLREQPNTSSRATAQLKNGMRLTVSGQGSEWCQVYADGLGATGYVMTRYLKLYNLPSKPTKTIYHPQGSYVNLRASANMTASVLARIPSGRTATVLVPGTDWTKVQYNGTTGYVMTYFLP